jgi:hypothetical protein
MSVVGFGDVGVFGGSVCSLYEDRQRLGEFRQPCRTRLVGRDPRSV